MKTFSDNLGRAWTVSITAETVRRVRQLIDFNLCETMDPEVLEKLSTDPILFCEILFSICKPEADALKVTIENFMGALGGDSLELALNVFLGELVNFFPAGKRRIYSRILEQINETEKKAIAEIEARITNPDARKNIDEKLRNAINKSFNSAGFSA